MLKCIGHGAIPGVRIYTEIMIHLLSSYIFNFPYLFYLSCFCFLHRGTEPCVIPDGAVARLPGDIIIGGLFPIHGTVPNDLNLNEPGDDHCTGYDLKGTILTLSMIYTIETINNSTFLPGIKLGYEIYDTCADVSKAIVAAMRIITDSNSSHENNMTVCSKYTPVVKAVVGERFSEISAAVARLFSIYLLPQISYSSSASILNDIVKFPSFLRTVPSDQHQTKALAKLVSTLRWNWVGIISSNDDYGRSALETLSSDLEQQQVCVAFKEWIPYNINHPQMRTRIKEILLTLNTTSSANVVFIFSKAAPLVALFEELIQKNITRTWIASDAWATSDLISGLENIKQVGPVLGISFRKKNIDGFEEYLQNVQLPHYGVHNFLQEYKVLRFNCTEEYVNYTKCIQTAATNCKASDEVKMKSPLACNVENITTENDNFLAQNIPKGTSYTVHLAVIAIAQAIQKMLCNNGSCQDFNFPPYKLLGKLKETTFSVPGGTFSFQDLGFMNGYDVVGWTLIDGLVHYKTIGGYDIPSGKIAINESLLPWALSNKAPFSNCSRPCEPGTVKKHSAISCCYECTSCSEGHFSDGIDLRECEKCPYNQWSNNGSAKCEDRIIQYFDWQNPFAIVLMFFSALGFVTVLATGVCFLKFLDTPAVKAAGGIYSCIMNLSLLFCFLSTGFFIGKPTDIACQIRQTMYGISFTLCVSCVLLKSLRILLAFELSKRGMDAPKVTYQPALFICVVTSIQILICMMWLLLKPPARVTLYSVPQILLLQCTEGSEVAFSLMLGYAAFLACVCFAVAFKGRKLPEKYNEARLITFSMLMYLFVWVAFIPIYVTTYGLYVPAVQVIAILASNYGIISCHLLPTGYIIFFKRESNTIERYKQSIQNSDKGNRSVPSISTFAEAHAGPMAFAAFSQTNSILRLKHFAEASFARRKRRSSSL